MLISEFKEYACILNHKTIQVQQTFVYSMHVRKTYWKELNIGANSVVATQ